ncbi:cupin domain-containing protein [Arenibacterium halophilum]|uniref:Cupin domain-containing protein n=1 Tax=Arenibacterium halophilum TaxID=2583821 RepID=A0ABY2WZB5_9RHOB|nr:cupin domain-containing protein [Arenibacterium halophilum]TMV08290.1 cupin domain-containing protein [Arenibacterium halophilum]
MDKTHLVPPSERTYGLEHIAIGSDVRVSLQSFAEDQHVPWHYHSEITDTFICIEGKLLVQQADEADVVLAPGERFDIAPGVHHRVASADGNPCRSILIQGVGRADFLRVDP